MTNLVSSLQGTFRKRKSLGIFGLVAFSRLHHCRASPADLSTGGKDPRAEFLLDWLRP